MRETLTDGRTTILDKTVAGSEIYMMANQLALLSLTDLTKEPVRPAYNDPAHPRPRIIAFSEVNDFLTYEINPFFENLWSERANQEGAEKGLDAASRAHIRDTLGFDFVDIRVEFADPLISLISGFVDPIQAHAKHVAEPGLIRMLLCGAQNGEISDHACEANNDDDEKS